MSAPSTVQQLMPPIRPIATAQAAWIAKTADLASAFSTEVQGDNATGHAIDAFYLQTAADLIWSEVGSAACWSKLDVEQYFDLHEHAGSKAERDQAVLTLLAFFTWLANNGHLPMSVAIAILQRIERQLSDRLYALGYAPQHGQAPRALRPALSGGCEASN